MKMIEVVHQLVASGHHVEWRVRSDGGILITNIDGRRFTGAKGNAEARQMTGQTLSGAREKQLKHITKTRTRKRTPLPQDIKSEYERVKKIWNKRFRSKKGQPHPAGYFDKSKIEWAYRKYGKEEAMRRISEAERYASGLAYSENVRILAYFIIDAGAKYESPELTKLGNDVLDNGYSIRDEWIQPAYQELYKLQQGNDPKEIARNTRKILRL